APSNLVALRVAGEEVIAGSAEPPPDRFRPASFHRSHRLPFILQPSDLGRGGVPVGRIGERLDLRAERFFLRDVLGPPLLVLGEIGLPAREEAIAGAPEALPDHLLLAVRHGADRL